MQSLRCPREKQNLMMGEEYEFWLAFKTKTHTEPFLICFGGLLIIVLAQFDVGFEYF